MPGKRLRDKSMSELRVDYENILSSITHGDWQQPSLGAHRRRLTAIRKEIGQRWAKVLHANWEPGRLRLNGAH